MKKNLNIMYLLGFFATVLFACQTLQEEMPMEPNLEIEGEELSILDDSDPNARKGQRNSFGAFLIGTEEVPSVNSMGSGAAFFEIVENQNAIKFEIRVANTQGIIFAHIHNGAFGENGPVVVDLIPNQDPSGLLNGVIAEGMIRANNLKGTLTGKPLSELIAILRNGMAYVNIHTATNRPGELRGQISLIEPNDNGNFTSQLSGNEEVPAVDTKAKGVGIFRFNRNSTMLDFMMNVSNIEDIVFSHIHLGKRGANGPVVVTLDNVKRDGRVNGVYARGMITNDDLRGKMLGGDLLILREALRTGNAYINIHSTKFPGGELRGQL